MVESSYKLIATIPSLKIARAFPLAPDKRYLLGSTEMEPEMLVFSHDRSLSRRQAWLEIVGDKLRVERHPLASQKLNGDDAVKILELKIGDDFTAGLTIFQFVSAEQGESEASPDLTFVLSSASYALWTREVRDFINVVGEMPGLMKANETPADFLLALCEALQKNVSNLQVSAWLVKQTDDLPELVPLGQNATSTIRPSRHLVKKAMTLAGDECAVSFWHSRASAGDAGQSLISSGVQRCGIGLAYGKVLAGLFTAHDRLQTQLSKYTVIGRAVNQAARLEGMTKKLGVPILIDGALAAALSDEKLLLRRIARVQPAGMQEVVEIYEVVLPRELGGTGIAADGIQAYAAALDCFEQGDFAGADMASRCIQQDRITLFLHEHIMKYLGNLRPENWPGVISLVAK